MCRMTANNKIKRPDENQVFGGDDRDRTDYLLNAIQALSQVSYAPKGTSQPWLRL